MEPSQAHEVHESGAGEMIHDMAGKKFGKITVVDFAFKGKDGRDKWNCCCDCGKELVIDGKNLRTGNTKSCGCVRLEKAIARILTLTKTHGLKKTRLYRLWAGMKARCNNPNTVSYRLYGGRGIKVCNEWNSFENFYQWSIANGYSDNLSIDRINSDKDYAPDNCRWVSLTDQSKNTRHTKNIEFRGMIMCAADWSRLFGRSPAYISQKTSKKSPSEIDEIMEKSYLKALREGTMQ